MCEKLGGFFSHSKGSKHWELGRAFGKLVIARQSADGETDSTMQNRFPASNTFRGY